MGMTRSRSLSRHMQRQTMTHSQARICDAKGYVEIEFAHQTGEQFGGVDANSS